MSAKFKLLLFKLLLLLWFSVTDCVLVGTECTAVLVDAVTAAIGNVADDDCVLDETANCDENPFAV